MNELLCKSTFQISWVAQGYSLLDIRQVSGYSLDPTSLHCLWIGYLVAQYVVQQALYNYNRCISMLEQMNVPAPVDKRHLNIQRGMVPIASGRAWGVLCL